MYNALDTKAYLYRAYCRKSSDTEDRQVQSLDRQEGELRHLSDKLELRIYENDYLKESRSAFSPGRPLFDHIVRDTKQGRCNAWFVWHANRLSRNAYDSGVIIQLMDDGLLHHIRTPSRIYCNTPEDKWMLQLEFANSKKDSDDKSRFVKSGLRKRYEKGYPSGIAPLGFLNDKSGEQGNRGWLIDEERFPLIRNLFREYLTGRHSIRSITEYARTVLKLTTVPRKRQGGRLVINSVIHAHILTNPVYAGFFYAPDVEEKRKRYPLNNSIPRVITEAEHHQIQQMLSGKTYSKKQCHESTYAFIMRAATEGTIGQNFTFQVICDCKHKFSYRNRVECPRCGVLLAEMKRPKYLSYIYYYNVKRRKTKGVIARTIEEKRVENFLIDYFRENLQMSPALAEWSIIYLKQLLKKEQTGELETIGASKDRRIEELRTKKKRLREMYMSTMVTREEYEEDRVELDAELSKLSVIPERRNWTKEAEDIVNLTIECVDTIKSGSQKQKKQLLAKLRLNLIWDEKNLSVYNAKPVQAIVNALQKCKRESPLFEPGKIVDISARNKVFMSVCPVLQQGLDDVRTLLQKL